MSFVFHSWLSCFLNSCRWVMRSVLSLWRHLSCTTAENQLHIPTGIQISVWTFRSTETNTAVLLCVHVCVCVCVCVSPPLTLSFNRNSLTEVSAPVLPGNAVKAKSKHSNENPAAIPSGADNMTDIHKWNKKAHTHTGARSHPDWWILEIA